MQRCQSTSPTKPVAPAKPHQDLSYCSPLTKLTSKVPLENHLAKECKSKEAEVSLFADQLGYQLRKTLTLKGTSYTHDFDKEADKGGSLDEKINEMVKACKRDIDRDLLKHGSRHLPNSMPKVKGFRTSSLPASARSRELGCSGTILEANEDDDVDDEDKVGIEEDDSDGLRTDYNDSEANSDNLEVGQPKHRTSKKAKKRPPRRRLADCEVSTKLQTKLHEDFIMRAGSLDARRDQKSGFSRLVGEDADT